MTLSDLSIERPVFTWMMVTALIVFGALGYNRLGVEQFPEMDSPVLTVTAMLPGADPESVEQDVTDIIEEQVATISGVRSVRSTSYRGAAEITIEFELDANLDVMSQEVRDVISRARNELPVDMEPPIVMQFNAGDMPIVWIPIVSERPMPEITEFVERQMKPLLETIPGVAGSLLYGAQKRAIRIWLDGSALRARGLASEDIRRALARDHVDIPGGELESGNIEYAVKTDGEFHTLAELETLVVSHVDGRSVLLRDVARVEDGAEDATTSTLFNGQEGLMVGIMHQSGENIVGIVDEVYARLPQMRAVLPEGISILDPSQWIDFSTEIRVAVDETEFALVFGALLAVFVVFVFLRRTRPTLIVAAAIPISLIATFGLVWIFGYTLNTMTLLGMALAVGVVIDDAIVVLENIERHREQGASAREAASTGTREIAFAATAATVSVAAVFLPVVFVDGIVGSFLGEFGLTVAGSVIISLFVALTLTPMLAARMPPPDAREHGSIYDRLERGFGALEAGYRRVLGWTLTHRGITALGAFASLAIAFGFSMALKSEMFPPTDSGILMAKVDTPPGTSLERTLEYVAADDAILIQQPEITGIMSAAGMAGAGMIESADTGLIFATLTPSRERDRSLHELAETMRARLGSIPGRTIRIFTMSDAASSGKGDFEFELLGNVPLVDLDGLADRMIEELEKRRGMVDLDKSLKLGLPEISVVPDREKAAALGIDTRTIASAIQAMVGGVDVGVYKDNGRRYDIRMRLEAEDRADPESIKQLSVRNQQGELVELRNLVHIEHGAAASAITRSQRQRSVGISGNLTHEMTLGEAIVVAREVADKILPEGVRLELAHGTQAMEDSGRDFGAAMGLALLVIYMVLAAQFESFLQPLIVMLALPFAMVGALGGLLVFGHTLNLFSLIGILLLFGLVTKNSILLVDYANKLRAEGMDKLEAMRTAAPIRMRPVLMTALSMIFGVLPAALGIGPGSETRAPMAIATAAGMLSSTLLTLMVVPVFYLLLDDAVEAVGAGFHRVFSGRGKAPVSVERG